VRRLRDACAAEQPGCAAYDFATGLVRSDGHGSSSGGGGTGGGGGSSVAMCGARTLFT